MAHLPEGQQVGTIEKFVAYVPCPVAAGHPGSGHRISGPGNQPGKRPRGDVLPRARGNPKVVIAIPAAARRRCPGAGQRESCIPVVDDQRGLQRITAVPEGLIDAIHVHELRVVGKAVAVESDFQEPVDPIKDVGTIPIAELSRSRTAKDVVVAVEPNLAVIRHVDGIPGLHPKDIVTHGQIL